METEFEIVDETMDQEEINEALDQMYNGYHWFGPYEAPQYQIELEAR